MTTLEGNKLIAEFMGFSRTVTLREGIYKVPEGQDLLYKAQHLHIDKMTYHSSWDLLMPVVEKIESDASQETGHCEIHIIENHCRIYRFSPTKEFIKTFNSSSKILAVWEALVQYVQWYNKQNNSE